MTKTLRASMCSAVLLLIVALAARPCPAAVGEYLYQFPMSMSSESMDISPNDIIYTVDNGERVQALDLSGNLLLEWGGFGDSDGKFRQPMAVACDANGDVYVGDCFNRVQVFDANGTFLRKWGSGGTGPGQFINPSGIDIDALGNVYVVDFTWRIQVFDRNGTFLRQFNDGVEANYPGGDIAVGPDSNVYAITASGCVSVYDSQGTLLRGWCPARSAIGVAVGKDGTVYVSHNAGSVSLFDPQGRPLAAWGGYGDGPGQFGYLYKGLALDSQGRLFVGDPWNSRIQVFEGMTAPNVAPVLEPISDRSVAEAQTLEFTLAATDPDGDNLVFSAANLPPGARFDATTRTFSWTPGYDQAGVYADVEFTVVDDGDPIGVDAELVTITVGNVNRPPVFVPTGAISVAEFEPVLFVVTASDPDGDPVALSAGPLPEGAAFDPASGQFTWTPTGSQVGNYTFAFFALDDEDPPLTGQMEVQVAVADVPPGEQAEALIAEIVAEELPSATEDSMLANLKKVNIFVQDGKIYAAVNQVQAFIQKAQQDLAMELITQDQADRFLAVANEILEDLQGQ